MQSGSSAFVAFFRSGGAQNSCVASKQTEVPRPLPSHQTHKCVRWKTWLSIIPALELVIDEDAAVRGTTFFVTTSNTPWIVSVLPYAPCQQISYMTLRVRQSCVHSISQSSRTGDAKSSDAVACGSAGCQANNALAFHKLGGLNMRSLKKASIKTVVLESPTVRTLASTVTHASDLTNLSMQSSCMRGTSAQCTYCSTNSGNLANSVKF